MTIKVKILKSKKEKLVRKVRIRLDEHVPKWEVFDEIQPCISK